jgi:lactoylglutathione lyase
MSEQPRVRQMRLVVTVDDYDRAVRFYRDTLGMPEEAAFSGEGGHVVILDAGRATLEIADRAHAEYVDRVEVGHRVAGHVRVALEVADASEATGRAAGAGAGVLAEPTRTPWGSLNSRLDGPGGLQLTLFEELSDGR